MFKSHPLKSKEEIAIMRTGGKLLANTLQTVKAYAKPGITTGDLNACAEKFIAENNLVASFKGYQGFPASITTAVNEEVVHGIPGDRVLNDGDIICIDCGIFYKGLHTDAAISFAIGTVTDKKTLTLLKETRNALYLGIDQIKPGNHVGDIGYAIDNYLKGFNIETFRELTGHGVGHKLHEYPYVPNQGQKGEGPILKAGMTLAIEPITCLGKARMKTLKDNWTIVTVDGSLASQEEHTVLVTDTGFEILTEA